MKRRKAKKSSEPSAQAKKKEDWTATQSDVGVASPGDHRVATDKHGHLATETARKGMFMSFEERHSIIKQNVAFFAPQPSDSSTTEVDSVTSYQAQMAMSLTSPKNEIVKIFCFLPQSNGASSIIAVKIKYGVTRTFQLRLGLNEYQERVAVITFSIETSESGESSSSSSSSSSSASDNGASTRTQSHKTRGGAVHGDAGRGRKKVRAKKGSVTRSSSPPTALLNAPKRLAESHRDRLTGNVSNSKSSSSLDRARQAELMKIAEAYGGGSGYFETFVTAVAHEYAANFCFRKQQSMKMASHLPQ